MMPFSHVQLNVFRMIVMSTSAADLIGTCACAQGVHFEQMLLQILSFDNMRLSDPVVFGMHRSRRVWAFLSQVKKNSTFFALNVYLRSIWDYQTFIKFLPQSQQVADSYRHYGFDLVFLQCLDYYVLLNTVLSLTYELSYKFSLTFTVMSTSASLVSMTALFYTWEWWC